jgi:hypothetical protein
VQVAVKIGVSVVVTRNYVNTHTKLQCWVWRPLTGHGNKRSLRDGRLSESWENSLDRRRRGGHADHRVCHGLKVDGSRFDRPAIPSESFGLQVEVRRAEGVIPLLPEQSWQLVVIVIIVSTSYLKVRSRAYGTPERETNVWHHAPRAWHLHVGTLRKVRYCPASVMVAQ